MSNFGTPIGKRGKVLESLVETVNRIYSSSGQGRIDKISTPTVRNRGKMVFSAKSTVDYNGVVPGGRFVAFDAKECQEKRFPMGNIKDHQVAYLREVGALGGIAFFLIYMRLEDRIFVLPPTDGWMKIHRVKRSGKGGQGGMKGMSIEDLRFFGPEIVDWSNTYPICDYLKYVTKWNVG